MRGDAGRCTVRLLPLSKGLNCLPLAKGYCFCVTCPGEAMLGMALARCGDALYGWVRFGRVRLVMAFTPEQEAKLLAFS